MDNDRACGWVRGYCAQKFIREVADLKTQLSDAIANMIGYEVMNGSKVRWCVCTVT